MFLLTQGTTWSITPLPLCPNIITACAWPHLSCKVKGKATELGGWGDTPEFASFAEPFEWFVIFHIILTFYAAFNHTCCTPPPLCHSLSLSVCQCRVAIRVRSQLNYSHWVRGQKGKANGESVMHKQHDNISQTFQYCNIGTFQLLTRIKKRSAHGCCLSPENRAEIGVLCAHVERDSQLWHIISEASNCQWIAGRAKVDSK